MRQLCPVKALYSLPAKPTQKWKSNMLFKNWKIAVIAMAAGICGVTATADVAQAQNWNGNHWRHHAHRHCVQNRFGGVSCYRSNISPQAYRYYNNGYNNNGYNNGYYYNNTPSGYYNNGYYYNQRPRSAFPLFR